MTQVTEVIVVHDSRCGSCNGIADRLEPIMRYPVLTRSCHDPTLGQAYPELRTLDCREPALGVVRSDGSIRWWLGRRAIMGALPVVRPSRLVPAVGVLRDVLTTRR
jgi:hypothetical protein